MAKKTQTSSNMKATPAAAPRHRRSQGTPISAEDAIKAPSAAAKPVQPKVTHEEISRLAYSYFEQRGYQPGSPDADWARAENELTQRKSSRH